MRKGRKSAAQTQAPLKDRIKGSIVNKKGSASSAAKASNIVLSDEITEALSKKAEEFNEKHKNNKVSLSTLKAVFRRGAGAFSTSHRPNMTRNGWAYARVNKFLEKKAGKMVKKAYIQDDDLLEKGGTIKLKQPAYSVVGIYVDEEGRKETEDLTKEGLLGYRIRYNKEPNRFFGYTNYNTDDLETAKKYEEKYNKEFEEEKEYKKTREAENKIKREQKKIEEEIKLQSAQQEIVKKPAYLMEESEYQSKVIPLLKEYEKFVKKNDQYLAPIDYDSFIRVTFEEALEKNLQGKALGYNFRLVGGKYEDDMTQEQKTIQSWNYLKFRNFENKNAPNTTPIDILDKNKEFLNKFSNYFSEELIYKGLNKSISKSNKWSVKLAIEDDTYKKLLEEGELTENELEKISSSVDVKVPKKVFSKENVKAKETQALLQKFLKNLPTININKLNELIESIKIDFKPIEEETFIKEKRRFGILINELLSKDKAYETFKNKFYDISLSSIPIWADLFNYENRSFDEVKTGRYSRGWRGEQGDEIVERNYYVIGLSLKYDWESILDKFIKEYVDTLKYKFIDAIIKNFSRVSKPISSFRKIKIEVGKKGFEGIYRFDFEDGSHFEFKAEAIPAGGYNIQAFHYRYITNFENITLADGSKVKGYYSVVENFSSKKMAHGGQLLIDDNGLMDSVFPEIRASFKKHGLKIDKNYSFTDGSNKTYLPHIGLQKSDGKVDKVAITYYADGYEVLGEIEVEVEDNGAIEIEIEFPNWQVKEDLSIFARGGQVDQMHKKLKEELLGSAFKSHKDIEQIAQEKDVELDYAKEQLRKGMKVESEHSDDPMVQEIIALQHLDEMIDYYDKLEYVESAMMEKGGVLEFNKNFETRLNELKKEYQYDGSENDLSKINADVAISYMQYLAKSIGEQPYQWDWENESKHPTDYFHIEMQLESGNILRALFVYVDNKNKVVKSKSNVKLYDNDYNEIKVLVEETKIRETIEESFNYKGIDFEIIRANNKWIFFGKYLDNFQSIPKLQETSKNKLIDRIKRWADLILEQNDKTFEKGGQIEPDNKKTKDMITHKSGNAGGMLVGNRHSEGGIKAINKSTDAPLEMEGGEVVITRNAVSDDEKREFDGEMLTNREILSKINEGGGGVSFEEGGAIDYDCDCDETMAEGGEVDHYAQLKQHFQEQNQPVLEVVEEIVEIEIEEPVMPTEILLFKEDLVNSEDEPMIYVGSSIYSNQPSGIDEWIIQSFTQEGVNLSHMPRSPLSPKYEDKYLSFDELESLFAQKAISIKYVLNERELKLILMILKEKLQKTNSFKDGGLIFTDKEGKNDEEIMESQFGNKQF